MSAIQMKADPYNIIITGVGGQGNVSASRILGNMLARKGWYVTIGETFGASQRGGSVMSHLRISKEAVWSPQIPKGGAHMVVALEPIEAIRVMMNYGNADVKVISNTRPIFPVQVIAGELTYPTLEEIRDALEQLSGDVAFLDATEEAVKLGHPILGNMMMIGAVYGAGEVPFDREDFRSVLSETLSPDKVEVNMKAFDRGAELVKKVH